MDASSFVSDVGQELKSAANDALNAVKQDGSTFVDRVREDLAGAVTDAGSHLLNEATQQIAPNAPLTTAVPLNRARVYWLVGALLALLIVVYLVARRRRKES